MTAPVVSRIVLPDDSANAGKNVRSQTRVVSGQTVHEHFFVPNNEYTVTGSYILSPAQQTVLAAAQNGTSSAFFWMQNPVASTVTAVIRRLMAQASISSALAAPTAPTINFSKFTFTGTASGATQAVLPYSTGSTTNQMIARTAATGMTVTVGLDVGQLIIPASMTAVGQFFGAVEIMPFNPLAFQRGRALEIGPGEGLVIWQTVAGTASDTRKFNLTAMWDEVDLT